MPNRLSEALKVLTGQRLTPLQIEAEWAEYQQIFRDLLQTFSASLAREAKAEKKRIDNLVLIPQVGTGQLPGNDRHRRKAELHAKMAGRTMSVAGPTIKEEAG